MGSLSDISSDESVPRKGQPLKEVSSSTHSTLQPKTPESQPPADEDAAASDVSVEEEQNQDSPSKQIVDAAQSTSSQHGQEEEEEGYSHEEQLSWDQDQGSLDGKPFGARQDSSPATPEKGRQLLDREAPPSGLRSPINEPVSDGGGRPRKIAGQNCDSDKTTSHTSSGQVSTGDGYDDDRSIPPTMPEESQGHSSSKKKPSDAQEGSSPSTAKKSNVLDREAQPCTSSALTEGRRSSGDGSNKRVKTKLDDKLANLTGHFPEIEPTGQNPSRGPGRPSDFPPNAPPDQVAQPSGFGALCQGQGSPAGGGRRLSGTTTLVSGGGGLKFTIKGGKIVSSTSAQRVRPSETSKGHGGQSLPESSSPALSKSGDPATGRVSISCDLADVGRLAKNKKVRFKLPPDVHYYDRSSSDENQP